MLIFFILFLLSVIFSSLTTIPFALAVLGVSAVVFRRSWVFFAAFFLGLMMDLFQLRFPGQTALFFVIFVFFLFLYKRKFETRTLAFIFIATFSGSFIYLKIFDGSYLLFQSASASFLAIFFFRALTKFNKLNHEL